MSWKEWSSRLNLCKKWAWCPFLTQKMTTRSTTIQMITKMTTKTLIHCRTSEPFSQRCKRTFRFRQYHWRQLVWITATTVSLQCFILFVLACKDVDTYYYKMWRTPEFCKQESILVALTCFCKNCSFLCLIVAERSSKRFFPRPWLNSKIGVT